MNNRKIGKKQKKDTMKKLSQKQKNVITLTLENMVEKGGKSKGKILEEAGYSKAVQKTPDKVFGSKRIIQALEEIGIDDAFLALKQKSHLNARKIEVKDTFWLWEEYQENPVGTKEAIQEELEEDMPGARIIKLQLRATRGGTDYVSVRFSYPEYVTQDKALDKVYKLRGDYAPEKKELSVEKGLLDLINEE